jgi:ribosomal protein L31
LKKDKATPYPYLTRGGDIVSGWRLEEFLSEVGSHEDPYYSNKNRKKDKELKRIRKFDKKAGREPSIPSDEELWNREEKDRERYMEMLQSIDANLDDAEVGGGTAGKKVTASATQTTQKEGASAAAAALEGQLTDLKGRCKYIFLCGVCL